jgi:hypothetical protein
MTYIVMVYSMSQECDQAQLASRSGLLQADLLWHMIA